MSVESVTYISDLNTSLPAFGDPKSEGDDHIRNLKSSLKTTFPGVTGAVTATHAELNHVDGVTSPIQAQLNSKAPLDSPTLTGLPTSPTASPGTNTNQIASTAYVIAERAATATLTNKTLTAPAISGPTGLVKTDVGLGNVDNTSDVNKPISTATQTALDGKQNLNANLTALSGLVGNGLVAKTESGTVAARQIQVGTGLSVTNADGVSGNPSIAIDLAGFPNSANSVAYTPSGTGAVATTVQAKLRETVSVKDFGAVGNWNGTDTSPGTGTDDTAAIQAAINYAVANGCSVFFPPGRYRVTAPLVIDRTVNTADPINGGMFGISLRGGGPASVQVVSDHNGACIDFRGGADAGWHTYFYIDGIGVLKANYARNVGSIGFKIDQASYMQVQRFDTYGFEYGIYGTDVLSSSFMDGSIRGNEYGFRLQRGSRSHPNNISFRGVQTINNRTYGGALYQPSVFSYIGGSIESNGYTGVLADSNSFGLFVDSAGAEGSVGVNMQGVYLENNNGKADVWVLQTTNNVIHNFNGCSFLRFLNTRYVTNCILFDSVNDSRISVSGCGFKDFAPYVSSASRRWIAAGEARIFDGGGNLFVDTASGYTGLGRDVFAPVGSLHELPFASLPSASKFQNGIQYCSDGGGGINRPSLAVSDGTRWWQIVLGQFAGNVASNGSAQVLPRGWSSTRNSTGVYTITHNLGAGANSYVVTATVIGAPGTGVCSGYALSGNTFEIYFTDLAGTLIDANFGFTLSYI